MAQRILLFEDDREMGAQVVAHLKRAGFEPDWRTEGEIFAPGEAAGYVLVIIDLMLPGAHGFDILKSLRADSDVPALVLSARNAAQDKVRALKLGADDYMTKPFWPEELIERVRARLRRPVLRKEGPLRLGALTLDAASRAATLRGRPLELTRVEFDLLAALVRRAGEAVTRRWLADHVLDPDREGTERTLDVHVSHLRKKLGDDQRIETVWGIGYRFRAEDET